MYGFDGMMYDVDRMMYGICGSDVRSDKTVWKPESLRLTLPTALAILPESPARFGSETIFVKEGGMKYGIFDNHQSRISSRAKAVS